MKNSSLKKYSKNKNQIRILVGTIIGLIVVIGGISLYRSFAMYDELRTFNLLNGTIPEFYNDLNLALSVDGTPVEKTPSQDGHYAVEVKCNKGKGIWKQDIWGVEVSGVSEKNVKCNINFITLTPNKTIEFAYKGEEEAISLTKGNYKLEVWGAQGGIGGSNITVKQKQSGLGGYSVGNYKIEDSDILYINVGGQGTYQNSENNHDSVGGYNGGANSYQNAGSGGGATHIALVSGLLSTLQTKQDQILIVAGGGGGAGGGANNAFGGSGGGIQGKNGQNVDAGTSNSQALFLGTGGTQTEGGYTMEYKTSKDKGTFGHGAMWKLYLDACGTLGCSSAGGGGGLYGGGGSVRNHAGAGGGSGYLNPILTSKEMVCYQCTISSDANTKTASVETSSSDATSRTPKQGNGYAKITYLGN